MRRSASLVSGWNRFSLFGVLAVTMLGIAAGGCKKDSADSGGGGASGGKTVSANKATVAVSSLSQTQEELNTAKANVKAVLASLTALKGSGGNQATFNEFKQNVSTMKSHATQVAARSTDLQERGAEYRAHWQEEVSKMDNPELRAGAEQRAAKVTANFSNIRNRFEDCRKAYQPFQKQLTDLEAYLSKDLSATSISVSTQAIDRASADGQTLNKALDELIIQLISVSVNMSPETKN